MLLTAIDEICARANEARAEIMRRTTSERRYRRIPPELAVALALDRSAIVPLESGGYVIRMVPSADH